MVALQLRDGFGWLFMVFGVDWAVVLICFLVGYAGLFLVDLRFALVIMVLVVWVFYLDDLVD